MGGEGTVKGRDEERRWRERFGPPKNFGVVSLCFWLFGTPEGFLNSDSVL